MSAISQTIVREFFEQHGFYVRQQRKFTGPNLPDEEEIDFYVLNPDPASSAQKLPFVLEASHVDQIARAVVGIKPWHTEVFSPGVIAKAPSIFRFAESVLQETPAQSWPGSGKITTILVAPNLPHAEEGRKQSIEILRSKGVDAVLPFQTMLADLINRIETNRNYQHSDVLQMLRILKNYEFFREPQLELFLTRRTPQERKKKSTQTTESVTPGKSGDKSPGIKNADA